MFHEGQRVVCVNKSAWIFAQSSQTVEVRSIIKVPKYRRDYTIRAIITCVNGTAVLLKEIVNAPIDLSPYGGAGTYEPPFCLYHPDGSLNFRPIAKRETSIELFEKIRRSVGSDALCS